MSTAQGDLFHAPAPEPAPPVDELDEEQAHEFHELKPEQYDRGHPWHYRLGGVPLPIDQVDAAPSRHLDCTMGRYLTADEEVRRCVLPKRAANRTARLRELAKGAAEELALAMKEYRRLARGGIAACPPEQHREAPAWEQWCEHMAQAYCALSWARRCRPAMERWAREEGAL